MRTHARFALIVAVCTFCLNPAPAAVYLLKAALTAIPADATLSGDGNADVVKGRLKDQDALRLEQKTLAWTLDAGAPFFVEFWLKPDGWDALAPETVELARFTVGDTVLTLAKPGGTSVLELRQGRRVLQTYPIYNWTEQEWMRKHTDGRWHYVLFGVAADGQVHLTVDGFAARRLRRATVRGVLARLALHGGPGTVYSWLHVVGEPLPRGEVLRARFRSLYRGLPDLHKNTITVPRLASPPVIDGKLDADEWRKAARITGFTSLKKRTVRNEDIHAYAGYDDRYLYLAVRTPYKGTLRAKHHRRHDMPLWGEESYEIFLHPPYTGTPDFCQLIGNPYGDQADLKMLNLKWDGTWAWKTHVSDNEWVAECRIDFEGVDTPPPGDFAVWTMNMISSYADGAWCWTQRYNDSASFGVMRLDAAAPVFRPGAFTVSATAATVPLEILGGGATPRLAVSLQVYAPGEVLPAAETLCHVDVAPGGAHSLELSVPLEGLSKGTVALAVREGETEYLFHSVGFPSAPMRERMGWPSTKQASPAASATGEAGEAKELSAEEKAYRRRWSAAELGTTLLESAEWLDNTLGLADDVPEPWTAMQVDGQSISCWGRDIVYRDSLLPASMRSRGEELLHAPARFVLTQGKSRHTFEHAEVVVEKQSDALVTVRAQSRSGPFLLETTAEWEFDGMGKIEFSLSCQNESAEVDGFCLELPIAAARAKLFHLTTSRSGHSPNSTSDAIGPERMVLDAFREVVWVGDHARGLCWFAESLEDWHIRDEDGIQVLDRARRGARVLRVKLADTTFRVERPWRLVFGLQPTPTRPRRPDFRTFSDRRSFAWCWFWGDGSYYPWQSTHVQKASAQIAKQREAGREVMPCSSLRFHGRARHHKGYFGEISNPGLLVPEDLIWGPLWRATKTPTEMPKMPERHTAPGKWYGQKYKPGLLVSNCAHSQFQDFYIWKLQRLIAETGLGAIYLDQPFTGCSNAHHGCGYINYRGEWTARPPLFAMRRMIKRMHRLFYDAHGTTMIKWHSSMQMVPPLLSFVDVFWDGENYGSGPDKVFEFYSKTLSAGRMQAQHTGIQFGFIPDLLPEFESRYAPSPASTRDMLGFFMIHDGTVYPAHTAHHHLASYIQSRRLSFPLAESRTVYYWQRDRRITVEPEQVKPMLNYGVSPALLVLYNWSDEAVQSTVRLDLKELGMLEQDGPVTDAFTSEQLGARADGFAAAIQPRGFRMLTIGATDASE